MSNSFFADFEKSEKPALRTESSDQTLTGSFVRQKTEALSNEAKDQPLPIASVEP